MIRALLVGVGAWAAFSLVVAFALGRIMRPKPLPDEPVVVFWSSDPVDAEFWSLVSTLQDR